ncbi:MAG: phosphatase PAP2 family protein [Pseudonocardiaceae bacterium]
MQLVDPALVLGWAAALGWVGWLVVSLVVPTRVAGGRPAGLAGAWRSQPVRHRVLLVGLGCAVWLDVAQLSVVDSVEDRTGLSTLDPAVTGWFVDHRSAALTAAAKLVSDAGGTVAMGVLALLGVIFLAWRRHWSAAGLVAVAALGAALLVSVMKQVLGRMRPPLVDHLVLETNASLPSGHALGSAVVLGILAAVALGVVRRPAARVAVVAIVVALVAVIGLSRLYLGVHWGTDVLTGWLLGAAWLSVCVTALSVIRQGGGRWFEGRRQVEVRR